MNTETYDKTKLVPQDYFAMQASDAFESGNYVKCLASLDQLEAIIGSNCKISQNRAVAEFYKSGCKDHAQLLNALNKQSDADTAIANSVAQYNKAVVYFHRKMYRTSIEALSPLVEQLDIIEESMGLLTCSLMLRLLLATNQLNKAEAFLDVLQAQLTIFIESQNESLSSEDFNQTVERLTLLTKMLNRKVVVIPENGSLMAALKAHQFYIMKDFQISAKQLNKINDEVVNTPCLENINELNSCIANNMGVIHLRVRHYAIAAKFFQNAIIFDKHIAGNLREVQLQQMSGARSCEILYNLGLAMLHLRRPQEAFKCFLVPLRSYHSNPRLWYRISEACIMEHEMKMMKAEKQALLSSDGSKTNIGERSLACSESAAVPEPNLEFAAISLRNALSLAKSYTSSFYTPDNEDATSEAKNWRHTKDNTFCNPSLPISRESLQQLVSAIYAATSYVSLRLGDYVTALEMAQLLLKADKLSDAHKMLAHMYAGEALVMLDKIADARPHLEPGFVSTLNEFDFETQDWQVKSLDAAQNIVRYNLAVAMVYQGDYDAANELLSTCTHSLVAAKVKSLKLNVNARTEKNT